MIKVTEALLITGESLSKALASHVLDMDADTYTVNVTVKERTYEVSVVDVDIFQKKEEGSTIALRNAELGQEIADSCVAGKWSLVSPDGRAWIRSDPSIIATVCLYELGCTTSEEQNHGTEKEQCGATQTPEEDGS